MLASGYLHIEISIIGHPIITLEEYWESLHLEAAEGLDVLPDVQKAIAWANRLIASIDQGLDLGI